ncbi:beta-1,4-glucosidase [Protomyces lactucae-debilis]|uniref:beta-glucosidase n=1 Tax=Protomyces lactucae-debilis TaxID=2754530 RepID=A0A1Y2F7W9_PROLT|nr:beta-1,4-glucosidase [Protomyces lactucae-debilis]ORY79998.1 beta-1,4-glucosidase [Protomyces lactucae-debilis]
MTFIAVLVLAIALPLTRAQDSTTFSEDVGQNYVSPPVYPSPLAADGPDGSWSAAYAAAADFVSKLTLVEKVNITTGTGWTQGPCVGQTGSVPRLGFPGLCLQDAPLGVRFADYVTAFPALSQVAKTWDRSLFRAHAVAMGEEFKGKGANVQLGPVCGPLGTFAEGGRNWEGYAVDSYLCGQGMYEGVKGIQSTGVTACAKHFLGNEQEHFRQAPESNGFKTHKINVTQSLSANMDDRVTHELYLSPFADAVRAGVGSIMCSYQQINNSYACQNSKLINGLLKDELAFAGFVVSDWGAVHSGVATYLAGTDMLMPGDGNSFSDGLSWFGPNLTISVLNGTLPETRLNDMAIRIMATYFQHNQNSTSYPKPNFDSFNNDRVGYVYEGAAQTVLNERVDVRGNHAKIARQVATESIILLKNERGALPLKNIKSLAIAGMDAGPDAYGPNGWNDRGGLNGTLAMGWGSGSCQFPYLITPLEAISARARQEGSLVQDVLDNYAYDKINQTVKYANAALVFINSDSGEGYISVDGNEGDRNNLTAWHGGDKLVRTVAANCNNTIVIVHSVGAIIMEPWINHENVTAVVFAGLPGQESGNSLTSVLYGDSNPSGKLTFTVAKKASDYTTDDGPLLYEPNGPVPQQKFSTLNIDYKHFDAKKIEPRFHFGYGLSYTTFSITGGQGVRVSSAPYAPRSSFKQGAPPALRIPTGNLNAQDAVYPADFVRPNKLHIYPWITSAELAKPGASYPYPAQNATPPSPAGGGQGGNPSLWDVLYRVTATVTNTGSIAGAEVAQLYVAFPSSKEFPSPPRQLRGFSKVYLQPGQAAQVTFDVTRKEISVWNTVTQNWQLVSGTYQFLVGDSSRSYSLASESQFA